jgi:hypothetical protein
MRRTIKRIITTVTTTTWTITWADDPPAPGEQPELMAPDAGYLPDPAIAQNTCRRARRPRRHGRQREREED